MRLLLAILALTASTTYAQWQIQDSGTTASLRGIDNVGNGIAWASGTGGTVLKTEDGGAHWQHCATPPDAEALDFRGVQAFDAKTAIVMSSGKGNLSRLYKTVDGCATWKLVFTNPDKDGFWDAVHFDSPKYGLVIGDPVSKGYPLFCTIDGGDRWVLCTYFRRFVSGANKPSTDGLFAASNSSFVSLDNPLPNGTSFFVFGTGGSGSRLHVLETFNKPIPLLGGTVMETSPTLPLAVGEFSGPFSLATKISRKPKLLVVVGGDYKSPEKAEGTAAGCNWNDDGLSSHYICVAAETTPHGYRSSVVYDAASKAWVTVGPNGTDVSVDDGKNWRPLTPGQNEAADADKNWNALSLPFVVGPKGRIGVLRAEALKVAK